MQERFRRPSLRSQSGLSVIEIMVGLIMISLLTAALLQSLGTLQKLQSSNTFETNYRVTAQALTLLLSEPELCKRNLIGTNFAPPATTTAINPISGQLAISSQDPLIQLNQAVGPLKTTQINLVRGAAAAAPNMWSAQLVWVAEPTNAGSMFAKRPKSKSFDLTVQAGADGRVVACSLEQTSANFVDSICADLGGTMVQTPTPHCQFQTCAAGYLLIGTNGDGTPKCALPQTLYQNILAQVGSCATGQFLVGFDSHGVKLCAAGSSPTTPPANTTPTPGAPTPEAAAGRVCDRGLLSGNIWSETGVVWNGRYATTICGTNCSGGQKTREAVWRCEDGTWVSENAYASGLTCTAPSCGSSCQEEKLQAIVLGWCAPTPTIVPAAGDGKRLTYQLCSCADNCATKMKVEIKCEDGKWTPSNFDVP